MKAPTYDQPPLDPAFMALQGQAKEQDISAIQDRIRGDSASLMARYGTMLAASNSGTPAVTPSTPGTDPNAPALSQIFSQVLGRMGDKNPFKAA